MENTSPVPFQACFVNTDQLPIYVRHIAYFTSRSGDEICLHEVIESTYPHPDAPDLSRVFCTSTRLVERIDCKKEKAAHLVLLEAAQNNTKAICNLLFSTARTNHG